jgi:hypothetical protein
MRYIHSFNTRGVWLQVEYADFWSLREDLKIRDALPDGERPQSAVLAYHPETGEDAWEINAGTKQSIIPRITEYLEK